MKSFRIKVLVIAGIMISSVILVAVLRSHADEIDQWGNPHAVKCDTITTITRCDEAW